MTQLATYLLSPSPQGGHQAGDVKELKEARQTSSSPAKRRMTARCPTCRRSCPHQDAVWIGQSCSLSARIADEAAEKAEREAARKVERESAKKAKREAARVAKMEASAQAKRETAEKVEAEREAAERAEREVAEQVIREVGEPAKSEVAAKPESGISNGPSFTDGIRRK